MWVWFEGVGGEGGWLGIGLSGGVGEGEWSWKLKILKFFEKIKISKKKNFEIFFVGVVTYSIGSHGDGGVVVGALESLEILFILAVGKIGRSFGRRQFLPISMPKFCQIFWQ